jgi:SAM-dependent methyltransferase
MTVSDIDKRHYVALRNNVSNFIKKISVADKSELLILDVAPEIHKGAKEFFHKGVVKTLDIDKNSSADYIADLCKNNQDTIPDDFFDIVVCTEVLEHTNNPFLAVDELYRIVKPNGVVAVSTPFNFRIHNPLPDNWRFTEHGLRVLFSKFKSVDIEPLIDVDRFLMPIQYTVLAKKQPTN